MRRIMSGYAGSAVLCGALALVVLGNTEAAAQPAESPSPAPPTAITVPGLTPALITPEAHEAIERGLRFLAGIQNRDGSWRSEGASGGYPTAMTALAGLAFLAGGHTPTQGEYARNVSGALTCILRNARPDGLIANLEEESHCMHGHGFAMLFLSQCYGMEEDLGRRAQIKLALERAVELTARSQSAAGGWLYTPDSSGDEGSVTVTQIQALRACRNVGIAVPKRVIDQALLYLERSANDDGGIRYQAAGSGPSRPAITAAAVVCWYNAGLYDHPRAAAALEYLKPRLTVGRSDTMQHFGHYFYGHLYMAQALYLTPQAGWPQYYSEIRDLLVINQEPAGSWKGDLVGPAYGTSIALIILQLPRQNLPIVQR